MATASPSFASAIDPTLEPLIDLDRFSAWMTAHAPGFESGEFSIRRLAGGSSNLTMLVEQGASRWVLRRPPLGDYAPTAHDMEREYVFYDALRSTAVPVPRAFGLCKDPSILGAPFYVMEYLAGRVLGSKADAAELDLGERRKFCESLAQTLAAIHRVDIDAAGLGTVAKREGYLDRQLKRWIGQWRQKRMDGSPILDEVANRLISAVPTSSHTTVVHGDYRIGNVMVDKKNPSKIIAVFDWEMATLGDPLADLGYSLIYWGSGQPSLDPSAEIPDLPGFMSEDQFLTAYEAAGGLETKTLVYYKILAWFKLAVISQAHVERTFQLTGEWQGHIIEHRDRLAEAALTAADESEVPGLTGR